MIYKILSSYLTTIILLILLAVGAAFGTFIENDFGNKVAKEIIYTSSWYGLLLFLTSLNIVLVIIKTKMYKVKARMLFHAAFVLIFLGALLTHFLGVDGLMHIREGEKSNIIELDDKKIETPFLIELKKFTLIRYPGSRSPSEYSSDVKVIDKKNNVQFNANIYMNNTLVYGGYKFFQTSYDEDEKGTVLSVNKDPGIELTYIGYAILFLGLILNLFDKKSRFQYLVRKLSKLPVVVLLALILVNLSTKVQAQEYSDYVNTYLIEFKENSQELSASFGSLVVQSPDGRMKPLDTQNKEVLNKLTGKSTWDGFSANQVSLGMFSQPDIWKKVNIIKVKTSKLKKLLNVDNKQKLVKFYDFFDEDGNYKLTEAVENAYRISPSKRGTFERDLIKVDEKLNIFFMSYRGVLFTIFPILNSVNNKWVDMKTMFTSVDNSKLKNTTRELLDIIHTRDYTKGINKIKEIKAYQKEVGALVIPSDNKLRTEIWFNKTSLFIKLSVIYLLFGFILLVYGFSSILNNKLISSRISYLIVIISSILLFIHTFGIAVRWYIGGFIPISSTYETMVFIAYSAVFAGVIFLRKSSIALASSLMMGGIFIFAAYLGEIDPEITSLVPVLKSYWLSIHVSVIVASYGFFGIAALIGVVILLLFISRNKQNRQLDNHIKYLSHINEVTLILGLVLLVIGNFLGGIWANESWGRYWGWDPKETWAYISIIVYTIVLHIRLVKSIYSIYLFTILTVIAFFSILMTYYGVNFYLSGLHSYATGDPVPIPTWTYVLTGIVLLLIIASYKKRKLDK